MRKIAYRALGRGRASGPDQLTYVSDLVATRHARRDGGRDVFVTGSVRLEPYLEVDERDDRDDQTTREHE